ncbi:MAG: hypothetical protein QM619_09805 [Micropruina sp.]|uniref:hypothetical protein n=1 Tax=Micropruina sp. TaxID=2737536 RepID=UPI0039E2AD1D
MIITAAPFQGTAAERLRHSAALRRQADVEEMRALAELAAEHSWTTTDELDVVGERAVRIGADGSRLVGEFLPLEVAAIKGISVTAATWLIRDVLNLEARHPALWKAVRAGGVPPYKAFKLAQLAAGYELSQEQALAVDDRLKGKIGRIGWARVMRLARGLIAQVATDKVEAATAKARAERFVRNAPDRGQPTVTELWARLDTTDAQQLEATIQAIAQSLKMLGDTDSLDVRRSKALGILATPARAQALLNGGDDQRYLPRTKVYLHLTPEMLTGDTVARCETLGPVTKSQLAELFGTHRITITPVLHTGDTEQAIDSYEIPNRIREAVTLRDVCEVFPYSSRAARRLDLDHTQPYAPGATAQTRPDNLGPLTRSVHRAKTAGRWRLRQPRAGTFWWTSPAGQRYRISPKGTDDLHDWSPLERKVTWLLDNG